jgi:hypothetical protein
MVRDRRTIRLKGEINMRNAWGVALGAIGLALGGLNAMATEEAKYEVLESEDGCELRDYASHVLAEAVVDGDLEDAGNRAFGVLFRYISGANEARTNIAMTAPVSQEQSSQKIAMTAPVGQERTAEGWAVSFMMPASFTLANTPVPTDSKVKLREVPACRMAAIRYSGFWSEGRYLQHKAELEAWIKRKGLAAVGGPIWARYNPPFTPWFLRRNEVLIPVSGPARNQEPGRDSSAAASQSVPQREP